MTIYTDEIAKTSRLSAAMISDALEVGPFHPLMDVAAFGISRYTRTSTLCYILSRA